MISIIGANDCWACGGGGGGGLQERRVSFRTRSMMGIEMARLK